jgi:hypothetical protein
VVAFIGDLGRKFNTFDDRHSLALAGANGMQPHDSQYFCLIHHMGGFMFCISNTCVIQQTTPGIRALEYFPNPTLFAFASPLRNRCCGGSAG